MAVHHKDGEKPNGAKRVYLRAGMESRSCSQNRTGHSRHSASCTHANPLFSTTAPTASKQFYLHFKEITLIITAPGVLHFILGCVYAQKCA